MEGETSTKPLYKLIEYGQVIYEIPIRKITNNQQVILWSDILSIVPKATCCLHNSALVPFQLDSQLNEILPKRISINSEDQFTVWKVHVPGEQDQQFLQHISTKLDYLIQQQLDQDQSMVDQTTADIDTTENNDNAVVTDSSSSSSSTSSLPANHVSGQSSTVRQDAPPSYETSMLSTIQTITSKLRLFESHIPNKHKSPKWLAKRDEWVHKEPNSIEEVAFLLVQLEMALLWTAVTESWIEERETWLTLVGNSRSERHLAGAILNLERHTLVMDENWTNIRERWTNELLEMVVLPLSHG